MSQPAQPCRAVAKIPSEKALSRITVVLTVYRRPNMIGPLLEAIRQQTVRASQIWIWSNNSMLQISAGMNQAKPDRVITSSANAYFHARFALALTTLTEYVAIFDDDSIPGPRWFENCLATMERTPGILGCAGVRLHDACYATATKHGWHAPTNETVEVDLVGHAWFLRTEWLHWMFAEPAELGTNGEDIELAARAMRFAGIPCYCPPHPPDDKSLWGSTRGGELGDDEHASFRRATHIVERDQIVQAEIRKGWRPLFMRSQLGTIGRAAAELPGNDTSSNPSLPRGAPLERNHQATEPDAPSQLDDVSARLIAAIPETADRVAAHRNRRHCHRGSA